MNILLSLLLSSSLAVADSAFDRCEVSHCLCEVEQGTPPTVQLETWSTLFPRRTSIYFTENSAIVPESSRAALEAIGQSIGSRNHGYRIVVVGYTDGCGSSEHNQELAAERIEQVLAAMPIGSNRPITIVHGEQTTQHSSQARRVDVVVESTEQSSLTARIGRIPADVYLIDGSGSMWKNWREFTDVVNASFVPGSEIYMSMMIGCRNGQNLDTITPQGGTEIWYSYWKVLDHMSKGETLLIISDFDSNVPLTEQEEAIIRAKAASKGIIVRTLR